MRALDVDLVAVESGTYNVLAHVSHKHNFAMVLDGAGNVALDNPAVQVAIANGDVAAAVIAMDEFFTRHDPRNQRASVVAVAIDPIQQTVSVAHIGDTRMYLLRAASSDQPLVPAAPWFAPTITVPSQGHMACLTSDHTTACELVAIEAIDREEGRRRARRRVLTRHLGQHPPADAHVFQARVQPNDRLLLCSAGLWLAIDDVVLGSLLGKTNTAQGAAQHIAELSRQKLGPGFVVIDIPAPKLSTSANPARTPSRRDFVAKNQRNAPPSLLTRLARDLSVGAKKHRPAIVGRKPELRQLIRALLRLQRNNALLIGPPGVGKTWLVEALAAMLASPGCPPGLRGKYIYELSIASLTMGCRFRGEFEQRIEQILTEAESNTDIILFLDEIHMIAAVGGNGSVQATDLFKPSLARGSLRIIGATTTDEFEAHLASHDAFLRRFQLVHVREPSHEDTAKILNAMRSELDSHHGLVVTDEAIQASVSLSARHITDRYLPDKAIDLLDQACVRAGSRWLSMSMIGQSMSAESGYSVTADDVAAVIAERCQLPLDLVSASTSERLQTLEELLRRRIIGQDAAMHQIATSLRARYAGLGEPNRPMGSFLFCGPTGVGKTATAKGLAELLFGDTRALLMINMSEYMEKHSVSRLLGAAPGYIGHDSGGQLVTFLRTRPGCVVLFDEVDKAHPDVLDLLLQILDEGSLRDARGNEVLFRESVVIMTSNLLATPAESTQPIGFGAAADRVASREHDPNARERLAHNTQLRPEFVGRIGQVVAFRTLDAEDLTQIAAHYLQKTLERVLTHSRRAPPIDLRDEIMARVSQSRFGARDVERIVDTALTEWLLADANENTHGASGVVVDRLGAKQRTYVAIAVVQGPFDIASKGKTAEVSDTLRRLSNGSSARDLLFLRNTGESVVAMFGSAAAAWEAVVSQPLSSRVRVAIHWGQVERKADGSYGGDTLDSTLQLVATSGNDDPAVWISNAARAHLAPQQQARLSEASVSPEVRRLLEPWQLQRTQ